MRHASKPTLNELLQDAVVDAALRQAWQDSNPYAPDVPRGQPGSLKQEQGGFIYWNVQTGDLEIERLPPGSREGLTGIPLSSTALRILAGSFHTHPNTLAEGYAADPSPADRHFTRAIAHVPEIIETHEGRKTIPYP